MEDRMRYRTGFIIWCLAILYAFFTQDLYAQPKFNGIVKGMVVDDSTNAPLPFANIFVANSTIGTAAGIDGKYQLKKVPYGIHQIVASIVGCTPQIMTVNMVDTTEKEIEFRLKHRNVQLTPVVVVGSEPIEWKRNLQKFIVQFFGTTPNAAQCKLLNPEVLDFAVDEKISELTATVSEPLVIENKALGYRFHYYLKYFKQKNEELQFFGTANYAQLHSESSEEIERWKINRQKTYNESIRHFFSALFHKNLEQEGFMVMSIPNREDLSTILSKVGVDVDLYTLLTDGESKYEKKLSFPDIFQVIYGYKLFDKRMSFVELTQQSITIYSNGEIAEPLGILTFGYWATQRAAEFLPSDYEP
jgi:hypothetical protein